MSPEEALKHISALVSGVHADTKPTVFWPTIEAVQGLVRRVEEEQAATRKRVRELVKEATAKGGPLAPVSALLKGLVSPRPASTDTEGT